MTYRGLRDASTEDVAAVEAGCAVAWERHKQRLQDSLEEHVRTCRKCNPLAEIDGESSCY